MIAQFGSYIIIILLLYHKYSMLIKITLCILLSALVLSAVKEDLMLNIPGYPSDYPTAIWSGYLSTTNSSRFLHYVFVESVKGTNNSDPVTLWLNGGPGCSSMLGFLQEIGPYYLEEGIDYQPGDNLTLNPYSWHQASNLLFLQSPAGVGYSYNLDTTFQYNDTITASDNFNAVLDFFKKYPQYTKNGFWIAGESYAGKYIPDLAVLIDKYNLKNGSINLKGILVGNGVMSFLNNELERSTIDYMINHEFIDPELIIYWKTSCALDPESAGCGYFIQRFEDNVAELNPYNVYDYCYYNDSFVSSGKPRKLYKTQESILRSYLKFNKLSQDNPLKKKFNGAPCAFFDGVFNYFDLNEKAFHSKFSPMKWNGPCADNITYSIDLKGSMDSYRYLLSRISKYQIVLYNGDWDSVVPYIDTIKNIEKLNLVENFVYAPWFTNYQHSGFTQLYSGVLFATFKGASHQVPQSKRPQSLSFFQSVLSGHRFIPDEKTV